MPGRNLWKLSPLFGRGGTQVNSSRKSKHTSRDLSPVNEALTSLTLSDINDMGNPHTAMDLNLPDIKINGKDSSSTESNYSGEVCLITESPFRILKLAANGKLQEFEKLYKNDPAKLFIKDTKGKCPIHHAASKGRVAIIEFILDHTGEINATDNNGNTALHLVSELGHAKAASLLLTRNADSTLKNIDEATALHIACEHKRKEVVTVFCNHPGIDLDIEGKHGVTPLHTCAYFDSHECAKKLIENGAKMCKPCHIGFFPIHIAAQCSSQKTFQIFVDIGKKHGYPEESINSFLNQEKNTPLHAAVNGGDFQVVRICLEAESPIDATTEDGSNAVHLAAAYGCLDIMKLLIEKQPEKKHKCIKAKDINGRTPLHRAALYDRQETVQYLLEEGAKPNETDNTDLTPWLLAASKKAWHAVHVLLKGGVDWNLHDKNNRNILHVIIMNGGQPDSFNLCFCTETFKTLLNEADNYGSTPLHYAAKAGMLRTIESMVRMGALMNAKNKDKQSPLHFAAKWGRYNTCKHLLDTANGPNAINDTDGEGRTPLHEAAHNGHVRVVVLLMQRGASQFRDIEGNSPVHLAAAQGYTQTLKVLLEINSHLMDMPNKAGDTPLHLAAKDGYSSVVTMLLSLGANVTYNNKKLLFLEMAIKNEHKDVCVATVSHDRWREVMDKGSEFFGCPMVGFVKHMPSVCQMVLDRCRTSSSHDRNSTKFHHIYDFSYLQPSPEKREQKKMEGKPHQPLCTLNIMIKYNRVECLSHPVVLSYLQMKWSRIGLWFHLVNLVVYLIFLASLTGFIMESSEFTLVPNNTAINESFRNTSNYSNNNTSTLIPTNHAPKMVVAKPSDYVHGFHHEVQLSSRQMLLVVVILTFCILNALKEIGQMYQQKLAYFTDITNLWEWILYITTAIFIAPYIMGHVSAAQWQCAAIAIFLAWFNLLIFLQRFDFFGIYVVMFLEILKTLVQVLTVFSILIVAFGLTFYVLFYTVDDAVGHSNFWMSLATTIVMMTGSIEYVSNWLEPFYTDDLMYQTLTFIMLIAFILLIPILLVNLLIGLAVGDIEAIQRDARLKRIAMQVVYNTDLESKMPYRILKFLDTNEFKVYPNCGKEVVSTMWKKVTSTRGADYNSDGSDASSFSTEQLFQMEHQSFIYDELNKQKLRLKQISTDLQRQSECLRLIIQKMEIKTEADKWDDDENDNTGTVNRPVGLVKDMGWSSPMLRHNLLKQSHIIAKWKTIDST